MASAIDPLLRFQQKHVKDSGGCWLWTGSFYRNGYGWLKVFGRAKLAHRFSYEQFKGPIGHGLEVLHSCDNKACVNPSHLRSGTHAENMREASERGLMRSGSKHPMFGKPSPKPKQSHRVCVLGKEYPSQKAAERALGLGSGTVRYWIKNTPSKAEILSKGSQCRA